MYDDDYLKRQRLTFLEAERPKELADLKRTGELEEHLQEHADACRRHAEHLIESGTTFKSQAWSWAVRSVLLERPYD